MLWQQSCRVCRCEGLTRLDYLKIDAEGAEKAILTGDEKVIQQFRPVIQIEIEKHDAGKARGYTSFTAPNRPNAFNSSREGARTTGGTIPRMA
jgi:Methyltransferase FkbM domain